MKLQHNIGGVENLGPVDFQKRVFVAPWEERIFGIHVAMMGLSKHLSESLPKYAIDKVPTKFKSFWTWGHLRTGAEGMNPFDYFKFRYYEKWLGGISGFFVQEGYITQEELDARTAEYLADGNVTDAPLPEGGSPAIDAQVIKYLLEGDSPKREITAKPKFAVGDKVMIKNVTPDEHTRLPGHLRAKTGVVSEVYAGAYTYFFPTGDGIGTPMTCYAVAFKPADIWGSALSDPKSTFYADLFEAYIEPA
ncbi:MAG: nitrile hydratase beta subunit [Gammaproteobacteria bacterium]|jgi:nitrile hydratase beta subunit